MSVYHRVSAEELRQCLASLAAQTRQPDQTVIVLDGPLPDALLTQLRHYQGQQSHPVELVELPDNIGLVAALNHGLNHCTGDWILRMDADDIAVPNRFEVQLAELEAKPEIDVLGSAMLEFDSDPRRPARMKPVLTGHEAIAAGLPLRNPMNHPTVCIRKRCLLDVGGYPNLALLEDYFLWAKLINAGAIFGNISQPLYLFRFDDDTLDRRGGALNFKNEVWLRRWMRQQGLISYTRFGCFVVLQWILRFAPLGVRRFLWQSSRRPYTEQVTLADEI